VVAGIPAPAVGAPDREVTPPTLPLVRFSLCVVTLLLLVACSGPEEEAVVLDEDAAGTLAQGADRLAQMLAAGDECGALAEADALVAHVRDGVEAGLVPSGVATEVEAVASETTDDLVCDPDEESDADDPAPDTTEEPEPDPEPESDPDPDPDPGGDAGRDDADDDGPGEGRGRGRDSAPGQTGDRSQNAGGGQGQGRGQALPDAVVWS
jgi:hypothetical protein